MEPDETVVSAPAGSPLPFDDWRVETAFVQEAQTAPFHGGIRLQRIDVTGRLAEPDVIACIPAKDEVETLEACLLALETSLLAAAPRAGAIVLLVNNSDDGSAALARALASSIGVPLVICEAAFDEPIANVGYARRYVLECAARLAAPGAVLLSSDADTAVEPGWAAALSNAARSGRGLVYGPVLTADGLEGLASGALRIALAESALRKAHAALWRAFAPNHPQTVGLGVGAANMAMTVATYRAVGGLPPLPLDEDRALAALMIAQGYPVTCCEAARIVTSIRLTGRVTGGMADTLAARCSGEMLCDPTLVPTRHMALLALGVRVLSGDGDTALALGLADRLGVDIRLLLPSTKPRHQRCGALQEAVRSAPLTMDEAEREVAAAAALLDAVRAHDGGQRCSIERLLLLVDWHGG